MSCDKCKYTAKTENDMNQHKIKKHHIEQLNGNTSTITLTSVKGVREKDAVLIDSSPPVNILVDAIDQVRQPGARLVRSYLRSYLC